jgi:hypothetical protein
MDGSQLARKLPAINGNICYHVHKDHIMNQITTANTLTASLLF